MQFYVNVRHFYRQFHFGLSKTGQIGPKWVIFFGYFAPSLGCFWVTVGQSGSFWFRFSIFSGRYGVILTSFRVFLGLFGPALGYF